MEYQNHGLFCCPRHSQVITRWQQGRLLCLFDIYLFLFVRRTGRWLVCYRLNVLDIWFHVQVRPESFIILWSRYIQIKKPYELGVIFTLLHAFKRSFLRKSPKISLALTEYNPMAAMEFSQQEQVKYIKLFFSISPYENISKLPVSIAIWNPYKTTNLPYAMRLALLHLIVYLTTFFKLV